MSTVSVSTFTATLYVGFKERDTGRSHTLDELHTLVGSYCNREGDCVTITPPSYAQYRPSYPGISLIGSLREVFITQHYRNIRENHTYSVLIETSHDLVG